MRDGVLRLLVLAATAGALLTEILSTFHLIDRMWLSIGWALLAAGGAAYFRHRPRADGKFAVGPFEMAIWLAIGAIVALVATAAWLSPPNTFDALAYHMPRIVYWAQAGSVGFFPTAYLSQIGAPPLSEFLMLHTYVLSGGDHFVNLVSCLAFAGCIVGVSAIARAAGMSPRGQALAALFCATLPSAILQASGPKNDCMTALWLVALVYFAWQADLPFLGLALGLALATKGTAYLFAPPLLAAALVIRPLKGRRQWAAAALWMLGGVLLVNGPQYVRNLRFSGSPLGYDAPFDNGQFRWRNAELGWKPTVSNALRHLSEQLGSGNARWNRGVYEATLAAHARLGIDPQSPDSPSWSVYAPPANTRHEANANNRWHLLLLAMAAGWAGFAAWRKRGRLWVVYAASLAAAFLLFCGYLRWQPYSARLFLPLFVLGAPLAAAALERVRPAWLLIPVCLFLAGTARLPALENWTRPLAGPHNLFSIPRDRAYFTDIPSPVAERTYREAAGRIVGSGCRAVAIDIGESQLEYPLQALVREREPAARFYHAGVANRTLRYFPPNRPQPCAVVCLECAGKPGKLAQYQLVGQPAALGGLVLFLSEPVVPEMCVERRQRTLATLRDLPHDDGVPIGRASLESPRDPLAGAPLATASTSPTATFAAFVSPCR
jgi:hypothetical protein